MPNIKNKDFYKSIDYIFETLKECAIDINNIITQSNIEYIDSKNYTGDEQLQADVSADVAIEEKLKNMLPPSKNCHLLNSICSEEKEDIVQISPNGNIYIGYDPLDGSSIVDVNFSVGSIFGIYEGDFEAKNIIASVYIIYGPKLEIVIATDKIELFAYKYGKFKKIKDLELKEKGILNSPGGTQKHWSKNHKNLIDELFLEGYRLRYSGGMVTDLHQILSKGGGLFSYPATQDKPKGKLRKLFEVYPFAYIFEIASGEAINGETRILELPTEHLHDTTPCFFGSKYEIDKVKDAYRK